MFSLSSATLFLQMKLRKLEERTKFIILVSGNQIVEWEGIQELIASREVQSKLLNLLIHEIMNL